MLPTTPTKSIALKYIKPILVYCLLLPAASARFQAAPVPEGNAHPCDGSTAPTAVKVMTTHEGGSTQF